MNLYRVCDYKCAVLCRLEVTFFLLDDIGRVRYYTLPVATWKLAITNLDISGNGSVLLYQQDPSRNDCYGCTFYILNI